MPVTNLKHDLRPATLDDATIVADLETMRDPSEPRDPVLLRYWWQMGEEQDRVRRWIRVEDGVATAFIGASHDSWSSNSGSRFGVVRPLLRYQVWDDGDFAGLTDVGQDWLRSEGATTVVVRVRADYHRELAVLDRLGFRENRRMRTSELDLVGHRDEILQSAQRLRRAMQERGIDLHPLSEDVHPDRFHQLFITMTESEEDIPRTVPWREKTFVEWRRYWFDNPAIRQDRFWIAREGDTIVGCSVLDCPVVRGVPWTAYTGTVRRVRGRGIARALKYQSMAQAIEAGYTRVRTSNDADNPPILRINAEMGYRLVAPVIELHRPLR
jgi:RimJ/RimL family protein N-acetyltransferase